MSYILDALRRADAERERERQPVPGLHSQGGSPMPSAAPPAATPWWPWALGAVLMVGSGLGAAWWWTRAATPSTVAAPPRPAPRPALPPAPVPDPAPQPPAATVGPTPTPPALHTPPASPAPVPPTVAAPAQPRVAPSPAPVPAQTPTQTPAPAAAAPIQEASPALKREMARLGVSGSVYSDDPASRFVIVRGEVVHEGATLGPELVLEQIRPHELVLRYKGQRMRQPL